MSINKSYTIYGLWKWEDYFTNQIYWYLNGKNYNVYIKNKRDFGLGITDDINEWLGIIRKEIIIQNNDTQKFFVINHADQFDYIPEKLLSDELCVGALKCQYRKGNYGLFEDKVSSFIYGLKEKYRYFKIRSDCIKLPKINREFYFKGNETSRWHILKILDKMGIINSDYGFRVNGRKVLKLPQNEYLKNMACRKVVLSLPGIGNFCHRELEAFGINVPVLMPILYNSYYNDLIPNFHYISVDVLSIKKDNMKEYDNEEVQIFCEAIRSRYKEVIDDDVFLSYISKNAMKWFEENIVYPSSMVIMQKILRDKFNYIL